ncbi:hypothetical protein [uncultured Tateyamaria sp.]|uniref:hypothetical protein n=1 Tax=uncultured Tateyamaria sp. TaxID=455651 RepID=UPI00260EF394|nr:hypothetical protein [uncultured Tateyamaria sp.]
MVIVLPPQEFYTAARKNGLFQIKCAAQARRAEKSRSDILGAINPHPIARKRANSKIETAISLDMAAAVSQLQSSSIGLNCNNVFYVLDRNPTA